MWLSIFYRFCSRRVWSITDLSFASVGLSVFVRVAYGSLQTLASVGFPFFIVFVRVAYGPLQTFLVWGFPVSIVFVHIAYGPLLV